MKSAITKFYDEQIAPLANVPTTDKYVKCSFCEEATAPADLVIDATYPDEAFCSDQCLFNWDDIQVKYEEIEFDWDNELKRQQGF